MMMEGGGSSDGSKLIVVDTKYMVPVDRIIQTEAHIQKWHDSATFAKLWDFITKCNDACKGKKISECPEGSPIIGMNEWEVKWLMGVCAVNRQQNKREDH